MKAKRIEKKDLIEALRKFLKEEFSLVLAFKKEDGSFRTKIFRSEIDDICLFNPVYEFNTSIYLRRIFLPNLKILAILRPCEARAYVELKKLAQMQEMVVCGSVDCFGTTSGKNRSLKFPDDPYEIKSYFYDSKYLRYACEVCNHKEGRFGDFGIRIDSSYNLWFVPYTKAASYFYDLIENQESEIPEELERKKEVEMPVFQSSLEEFTKDFEGCIMCLNCRDMCPVCYCVDCLFNKDEFLPKGDSLINTILRSKTSEIPKNREIYHFIRMYHVSQTCVGCGSCEEACPKQIPLTRYFKGISERLSRLFDYMPGRSIDEKLPYTTYREDELQNAED